MQIGVKPVKTVHCSVYNQAVSAGMQVHVWAALYNSKTGFCKSAALLLMSCIMIYISKRIAGMNNI